MNAAVHARVLVSLGLALVGCGRTQLWPPPDVDEEDAGSNPIDAGNPDAGSTADGGSCSAKQVWHTVTRNISAVSLVEGPPPVVGTTERLAVTVQLETACDVLAGVDVSSSPGGMTDFVNLSAKVWVPDPPCGAASGTARWVVSVPGRGASNLRVVVLDQNSPGGGVRLNYQRSICGAAMDCVCRANTPQGSRAEGAACRTDCNCAPGLSCLGFYGYGGPMWTCARPCNDLQDCRGAERCLIQVADGLSYSCAASPQGCQNDGDCPANFTCEQVNAIKVCKDGRQGPTVASCSCDADCPAGQHCTQAYRPTPSCEVWCKRTAECPGTPNLYACSFKSTCVPLE